jgi:hypothetical protein
MQDNQDTETSTDEVQREYKREIPVEAKFSVPVQTDLGAFPTTHTICTVSVFRGKIGRGVALITHPHLASKLKKE